MVEKLSPTSLARKTIENFLTSKVVINPEDYKVTDTTVEKAGAFVSIKLKDGNLRGCIGTIIATQESIEKEIINNAISASTKDPRFHPMSADELNNIDISVDILQEPETVRDISELDPQIYGIIVKSNSGKQALLLPALEGLDTVETQITAAKRKAGIPLNESIHLFKFKVDRYKEKE